MPSVWYIVRMACQIPLYLCWNNSDPSTISRLRTVSSGYTHNDPASPDTLPANSRLGTLNSSVLGSDKTSFKRSLTEKVMAAYGVISITEMPSPLYLASGLLWWSIYQGLFEWLLTCFTGASLRTERSLRRGRPCFWPDGTCRGNACSGTCLRPAAPACSPVGRTTLQPPHLDISYRPTEQIELIKSRERYYEKKRERKCVCVGCVRIGSCVDQQSRQHTQKQQQETLSRCW